MTARKGQTCDTSSWYDPGMAKQSESVTVRVLNWVGASFIFALFGFTILAVVLAIADVFGPAVR